MTAMNHYSNIFQALKIINCTKIFSVEIIIYLNTNVVLCFFNDAAIFLNFIKGVTN